MKRASEKMIGFGLALLLAGTGAAQPQQEKPAKEALGLELLQGQEVVWQDLQQDGRTLLGAIAAARVTMEVEGDLAAASDRLMELSLQAASLKGFAEQSEALVQAALARSVLQQRLGDLAKATEELKRVLPVLPAHYKTSGSIQLGAPTPAFLQVLRAAQADARVIAALKGLEGERSHALADSTGSLDALVDDEFGERDYEDILAIGFPAFERFAQRTLETTASLPGDLEDEPLIYLIPLDERRAARFLAGNLGAGGALWKQRILRAMAHRRVLANDGTWTSSSPAVCLEPEWLELVEVLLGERETAAGVLPFFAEIERRDALTDGLNAAFARALAGFGPDFATLAMQAFDHDGVVASAQPALEAALALPDARLRRFAAQKLVNFPRSEALLARARDEDVEVRRAVVRSFSTRKRSIWVFEDQDTVRRDTQGRVGEHDSGTLRTLLADSDTGIRSSAVGLLDVLERPLDEAEYARLARDPAPEVRAGLVGVTQVPPPLRGRLLALLARDPAQQVVQEIDAVLESDFSFSGPISRAPAPYLEFLEERWKDAARPLAPALREKLWKVLVMDAEGTRAYVAWVLSAPTPGDVANLNAWGKPEYLLALPDELLARLLAHSDDPRRFERVWGALRTDDSPRVERPAAMRLLLADEAAPRRVRLTAAYLAADESPAFRQEFLALLHDPSWKARSPDPEEQKLIGWSAMALEPDARNALALVVLRDTTLAFPVADAFVTKYGLDGAGGQALAEELLTRWLRPGAPWSGAVAKTLNRLGQIPGLARVDRLEPALALYAEDVVDGIGEHADAQFLPLLARAMRADWLPYDQREKLQRAAARALGSFDQDEAVAILLEGLRSNETGVRNACLGSLERIKTYRAHVELWRGGVRKTPTKEGALAELLEMLRDSDPLVRKEAARGLGTLGATEALPDLIRALKDSDTMVRAAVNAAIGLLNESAAARPKEPAPAGG